MYGTPRKREYLFSKDVQSSTARNARPLNKPTSRNGYLI